MISGRCAFCGETIEVERIGFRALCPHCDEALHACLQCKHYAPGRANDCMEPQADLVRDKDRSNLCEWFRFAGGDGGGGSDKLGTDDADQLLKKLLNQQ